MAVLKLANRCKLYISQCRHLEQDNTKRRKCVQDVDKPTRLRWEVKTDHTEANTQRLTHLTEAKTANTKAKTANWCREKKDTWAEIYCYRSFDQFNQPVSTWSLPHLWEQALPILHKLDRVLLHFHDFIIEQPPLHDATGKEKKQVKPVAVDRC